jgi:ATP-dependent RNA helicase DeaD
MKNFDTFDLSPGLLQSLSELNYHQPTPIQAQTLPLLLQQKTDFLGLAATGTGKTAAFLIPALEQIQPGSSQPQVLILCPTRELALQITKQVQLLGKHKGIEGLALYGGSGYSDQIRGLKNKAPIVIGTPGRVVDHLKRGTLKLHQMQTFILDEADEMISMGFQEDLSYILEQAPRNPKNTPTNQIWLFSATMNPQIHLVAKKYLKNPKKVHLEQTIPSKLEQIYYMIHEGQKNELLCRVIDTSPAFYGLVFCQTKSLVMELTEYLKHKGYPVTCLHGDLDQKNRERTLQSFKNKKSTILICTDIASRGLDVLDLTHVINYSLPRELEHYIHRIGRTARSGKPGLAISFVTPSHRNLLPRIAKATGSEWTQAKLPTLKDIQKGKLAQILPLCQKQEAWKQLGPLLEEWEEWLENTSSLEIASRFLLLAFPQIFGPQEDKLASFKAPPERPRAFPSKRRFRPRRR